LGPRFRDTSCPDSRVAPRDQRSIPVS
jgi:hypothetical protein